jgi:anion-transporting  ArsA/GET3 family ATPase
VVTAEPPGATAGADATSPGLLDRRLVFVTGKGGVGKTTVAAALGLLAASQGRRTLVCEVEPRGGLSDAYQAPATSYVPREVQPRLWAMSMDTEAALREYLSLNLPVPPAARLGPLARAFDFVATAAPGVREILVIGKLCFEVREGRFDLVVVDASASGHVVGQLAAPQSINELVKVGLIRHQTDWMSEILSDPARTGLVVVATPEEMPVTETVELASRVAAETPVELAAVAVNRVLPELFSRREEEVYHALAGPERAEAVARAAQGDLEPVFAGAELAVSMRRTSAAHLARLRQAIRPEVPLLYVPYLFGRAGGLRAIRQVAEALAGELGY